jgi:hypothetical protein
MSVLERKVTVCDACETAACWQGTFQCYVAATAGTKELTVRELHETPRGESAENWFKNPATGEIDRAALAEYQQATKS